MPEPSQVKKRRVYLITPKTPDSFWSMKSTVKVVGAKTLMPNAALATLVSLTPKDLDIEYVYCDENLQAVNPHMPCDLVALTGFTLHAERLEEISKIFRKRGVPVAIGGTFASLSPDKAEPLADHLFIGEAELTWPQFLKDWIAGEAKAQYRQEAFIDMAISPAPDWSFVTGKDYLYFTVQISRGCPNNCDFCNSVRLVGRKHRHKSIAQVMTEIKNAERRGATTIFFSDDNFLVSKSFTMELLGEITKWNTTLDQPVSFSCQATVNVGNDEQVVKAMADAKFSAVFLGVESLRKECLDEVNKGRLAKFDTRLTINTLIRYGILPFVGLIVGFDHDNESTFKELEKFLIETGCPTASISVLNAPEDTTLYTRMMEQGRINEDFAGVWHFSTNIKPVAMTLEELLSQHRKLFLNLYTPQNYGLRAQHWLDSVEYFTPLYKSSKMNWPKMKQAFNIISYFLFHKDTEIRHMFFSVFRKTWKRNPKLIKKVFTVMSQFPHYYDFSHEATWKEVS